MLRHRDKERSASCCSTGYLQTLAARNNTGQLPCVQASAEFHDVDRALLLLWTASSKAFRPLMHCARQFGVDRPKCRERFH